MPCPGWILPLPIKCFAKEIVLIDLNLPPLKTSLKNSDFWWTDFSKKLVLYRIKITENYTEFWFIKRCLTHLTPMTYLVEFLFHTSIVEIYISSVLFCVNILFWLASVAFKLCALMILIIQLTVSTNTFPLTKEHRGRLKKIGFNLITISIVLLIWHLAKWIHIMKRLISLCGRDPTLNSSKLIGGSWIDVWIELGQKIS